MGARHFGTVKTATKTPTDLAVSSTRGHILRITAPEAPHAVCTDHRIFETSSISQPIFFLVSLKKHKQETMDTSGTI